MRNSGLLLAWLVGEGIVTYRTVKTARRPPTPGELLYSSGLFVLLALLGEAQPQLATITAWGFDIAAVLNLFGSGKVGKALAGPSTAGRAAGAAGGTAVGGGGPGGGPGAGLGGPVGGKIGKPSAGLGGPVGGKIGKPSAGLGGPVGGKIGKTIR